MIMRDYVTAKERLSFPNKMEWLGKLAGYFVVGSAFYYLLLIVTN